MRRDGEGRLHGRATRAGVGFTGRFGYIRPGAEGDQNLYGELSAKSRRLGSVISAWQCACAERSEFLIIWAYWSSTGCVPPPPVPL